MVLLCWTQTAFSGMSNEELLKRLNELSTTIQKQQQEIERLKQELQKQKESIKEVQETQSEKVEKAVKTEVQKQEKSWSEKLREQLPEWTKRIKISGDLRLRYERIWDRDQLQSDLTTKDLPDRDRGRVRLRLFVDGTITDEIAAHVMVTTNQDTHQEGPTSNQSFGYDFNDKGIWLGRAYATYNPKWLNGLDVGAGKFRKNFFHSDIMWDPDVNPEGAYELYRYKGSDVFQPFIYLSQLVVNEKNFDPDAMLYLTQGGFNWRIGPVRWTMAGSYYSWSNLKNSQWLHNAEYKGTGGNTFITDASGQLQYKYDFKLLEAITYLEFDLGPFPTRIVLDYIVNTADGVPSGENSAYLAEIRIGDPKKRGDYSLYYKYACIGKNAVVGSLNDQDFYGANRRGHKIVGRYMIFDHVEFRAAFFYTDPLTTWDASSPTFGKPYYDQDRMHEDRIQTDFIFTF